MIEVSNKPFKINLKPASEQEEIVQNVRQIVLTYQGEVPLDRGFGLDSSVLDSPTNEMLKAKLRAQIAAAIAESEPRADVKQINISGDAISGDIAISVLFNV